MHTLKIRVFKGDEPKSTVTIPLRFIRMASRLVPTKAVDALSAQGIDLAEIVRLSEDPAALGDIAVVEDHEKGEKTVISIE